MYQPQPSLYPPQPYPHWRTTRRPLSGAETCFHLFMTIVTGGLWGIVWWSVSGGAARSRPSSSRSRP